MYSEQQHLETQYGHWWSYCSICKQMKELIESNDDGKRIYQVNEDRQKNILQPWYLVIETDTYIREYWQRIWTLNAINEKERKIRAGEETV